MCFLSWGSSARGIPGLAEVLSQSCHLAAPQGDTPGLQVLGTAGVLCCTLSPPRWGGHGKGSVCLSQWPHAEVNLLSPLATHGAHQRRAGMRAGARGTGQAAGPSLAARARSPRRAPKPQAKA